MQQDREALNAALHPFPKTLQFTNAIIAALHVCPLYPTHFLLLFSWPILAILTMDCLKVS